MSLVSTWVRCRDGALYRNPRLVFPEGFVCFDEKDPPELVVWYDSDTSAAPLMEDAILRRVFRIGVSKYSADPNTLRRKRVSMRVVPDTDPWRFAPAVSFFFDVTGRIPRPTLHDGTERHASRLKGARVIDFEPHPLDVLQIEIPDLIGDPGKRR